MQGPEQDWRTRQAQMVLQAVEQRPGQSERRLSRSLGFSPSTVGWLLWHLEQIGKIRREVTSKQHHFLPQGMHGGNWRKQELAANLHCQRLLSWVKKHPGAFQSQIQDAAESWGWPRTTTQWRLSQLAGVDLLKTSRAGRKVQYHIRRDE